MPEEFKITPINHHILSAYHAWMTENGAVIHLMVDAQQLDDDSFLHAYANEQHNLSLSVGGNAARELLIDHEGVSFNATFNKQQRVVFVPIGAIKGIVGWLNGGESGPVSFMLPPLDAFDIPEEKPKPEKEKSKPKLTVVK